MRKPYFLSENKDSSLLACKAKGIKDQRHKPKIFSFVTSPLFTKYRDKRRGYHGGRRERATAQQVRLACPHHCAWCTTFHKLYSQTSIFKCTSIGSSPRMRPDRLERRQTSSKLIIKIKINSCLASILSLISVHWTSSLQTPILNLHCRTELREVLPADSRARIKRYQNTCRQF